MKESAKTESKRRFPGPGLEAEDVYTRSFTGIRQMTEAVVAAGSTGPRFASGALWHSPPSDRSRRSPLSLLR